MKPKILKEKIEELANKYEGYGITGTMMEELVNWVAFEILKIDDATEYENIYSNALKAGIVKKE